MAMALGLRPSLGFGQGTSQIAKRLMAISLEPWPKILDKLGAMAQDIRYPWVRVGEACGPGVAS